nr:MAG TPA: hypothetical protein [Caudoviricetes sp.]
MNTIFYTLLKRSLSSLETILATHLNYPTSYLKYTSILSYISLKQIFSKMIKHRSEGSGSYPLTLLR